MMTVTERVAIVVDPELPAGLLANTVALIAIGLGAAQPRLGGHRPFGSEWLLD
jgi:hypothetical protein